MSNGPSATAVVRRPPRPVAVLLGVALLRAAPPPSSWATTAFAPPPRGASPSPVLLASASEARGDGGGDDENDGRVALTFVANESFVSDVVPGASPADARAFLRNADPRLLLLMGAAEEEEAATTDAAGEEDGGHDGDEGEGGAAVRIRSLSEFDRDERDAIADVWRRKAADLGAPPPSDDDGLPSPSVCDLSAPAVSFPGFRVLSRIRLGVDAAAEGGGGEVRIVQLGDDTEARGLRPLVRAHDRITGKDGGEGGGSQSARSYCTIRPVTGGEEGGDGDGVRFEYRVFLEVRLEFAGRWRRLLPGRGKGGVDRAEAWGSAALARTVARTAPRNLRRLRDAFEEASGAALLREIANDVKEAGRTRAERSSENRR